jgi:hypothetical protein
MFNYIYKLNIIYDYICMILVNIFNKYKQFINYSLPLLFNKYKNKKKNKIYKQILFFKKKYLTSKFKKNKINKNLINNIIHFQINFYIPNLNLHLFNKNNNNSIMPSFILNQKKTIYNIIQHYFIIKCLNSITKYLIHTNMNILLCKIRSSIPQQIDSKFITWYIKHNIESNRYRLTKSFLPIKKWQYRYYWHSQKMRFKKKFNLYQKFKKTTKYLYYKLKKNNKITSKIKLKKIELFKINNIIKQLYNNNNKFKKKKYVFQKKTYNNYLNNKNIYNNSLNTTLIESNMFKHYAYTRTNIKKLRFMLKVIKTNDLYIILNNTLKIKHAYLSFFAKRWLKRKKILKKKKIIAIKQKKINNIRNAIKINKKKLNKKINKLNKKINKLNKKINKKKKKINKKKLNKKINKKKLNKKINKLKKKTNKLKKKTNKLKKKINKLKKINIIIIKKKINKLKKINIIKLKKNKLKKINIIKLKKNKLKKINIMKNKNLFKLNKFLFFIEKFNINKYNRLKFYYFYFLNYLKNKNNKIKLRTLLKKNNNKYLLFKKKYLYNNKKYKKKYKIIKKNKKIINYFIKKKNKLFKKINFKKLKYTLLKIKKNEIKKYLLLKKKIKKYALLKYLINYIHKKKINKLKKNKLKKNKLKKIKIKKFKLFKFFKHNCLTLINKKKNKLIKKIKKQWKLLNIKKKKIDYNIILGSNAAIIYPIKGIRIYCMGTRKKGKRTHLLSYHIWVKRKELFGVMPLSNYRKIIDYYKYIIITSPCSIGIKTWLSFNSINVNKKKKI